MRLYSNLTTALYKSFTYLLTMINVVGGGLNRNVMFRDCVYKLHVALLVF